MQRKLHNKVIFGTEQQQEDFETGKGMGMVGAGGSGFLRITK